MMLAASHLAMNQWFDMDEIFKYLVEGEPNYVCIDLSIFIAYITHMFPRQQFPGLLPRIHDGRDRSSSPSIILLF